MFKFKPDFEDSFGRYVAWWNCELVDRALTTITFRKPEEKRTRLPRKQFNSLEERWWDADYQAELACANLANTVYFADSLPVAHPNLGPEVFSAYYGCNLEFGERTSWSEPILEGWDVESLDQIRLDCSNRYFKKILEITDAFIEIGKGKFIVGYTDLHPGGDAIAAFRDPEALCVDMIEHPSEVKELVDRVTDDFLRVYDFYYEKLSAAGMYSSTWLKGVCDGKFHVPSNDFSCMISDRMFEEVFLPGIIRECRHMTRSIYHLDGPQALRFLDRLLEIPEIHAIQWVPGAGQSEWTRWVDVYRKIQSAGKAFMVSGVSPSDLDELFTQLRPEGVWLNMAGIASADVAEETLKKIARWS